ncbi:MAG: hypothetical protein ACI845_000259 [Gammaproteobacteria bacterium]|jgi:hypothetical protein
MQLKGKLSGAISLASCSLLSLGLAQADTPWDVNTAVMLYTETGRVSAFEPIISAKKETDDDSVSMKLTLDSLTGASATGAVPSSQVQTFTRPSGKGSYSIDPGDTPLDDTFHDTRAQFTMGWDQTVDRKNRRTFGFNVSREYDFTSISGNVGWIREFNQKNTSLNAGINLELDDIRPVGNAPLPLSVQDINASIQRDGSNKDKKLIDILFGVSQIIDRSSLFQLNLSFGVADGYLNDPYKLVSIVDSSAGANQGEPISQIYENRPDSRSRAGLFGLYKKQFGNRDILTASFRIMSDDWGVDSTTFDLGYRVRFGSGFYLQPRFRYYQQSEADFYRYFLLDSDTIPDNVSADYRLGDLNTTTVGLKFGKTGLNGEVWSFRIEQYVQSGESSPSEAIGQLQNQNLFPDVEATVVQFNASFQW